MNGCFKYCTQCKEKENCCVGFGVIDNPIISSKEKEIIQNRTKCQEKIFTKIKGGCFNINSINGVCPFYKNGCTIYDIRPNDCKLYPYDLKLLEDKFFLIEYKLKCLHNNILEEYVDEIISEIAPYINVYTAKEYNKKVSNFGFEIIKQIDVNKKKAT